MQTLDRLQNNFLEGTGSEHEDCYRTLETHIKTLSTQNLKILRNFQYWPKFLVSYKKYVYRI